MALTRITKGVIKPNENYDTHNIVSTGIVTSVGLDVNGNADVSGSLSVGGVLTYEDVTSIDSVGIITARSGLVSPYADIDDFVSVGSNIHLGNAGVVTATSFVGDGSGLIGVASTDNIVTGTAATFNTYPVDINAGMTVAGVTTTIDHIIIDADDKKLQIGDGQDLQLYHSGGHTFIENSTGNFQFSGTGDIQFVHAGSSNEFLARFKQDDSVELFFDGERRLSTTNDGIKVEDEIELYGTNPIIRFTDTNNNPDYAIHGSAGVFLIQDTTNTVNRLRIDPSDGHFDIIGDFNIANDLDVDGHTNLDNLSVGGATTITATNREIPFKVVAARGGGGIGTYLFTNSVGRFDFNFENTYNGNWYTGSTFHTRLLWTAPNEPGTTPEVCSIFPNTASAGAGGSLHSLEFSVTDNTSGLKKAYQMKHNQHQFYLNGNQVGLDINSTLGVGVTSYIYHGYTGGASDTNTRFGFSGNHNIIFDTDGIERLRINNSSSTFAHNIIASADLDVDGHTNLDNVSIAGVTTASGNINMGGGNLIFGDSGGDSDDKLVFGAGSDLKIFHNGSNNYIDVAGDGHLYIRPKANFYIQDYTNGEVWIDGTLNGAVKLYHDGTKRFETTGGGNSADGINVFGNASNSAVRMSTSDGTLRGILYANSNNLIGFLGNNGSWALSVANAGGNTVSYNHFNPSTDSSLDLGTSSTRWRNVYADTLYGDGSNLTGITQTTINSNTNNYVITGTGTANTLQGESTLTFDGTKLEAPRIDSKGLIHLEYSSSTNTNYMMSFSNNNGIRHLFRGDGLFIGNNMNTSNQSSGPNNKRIELKTNGEITTTGNITADGYVDSASDIKLKTNIKTIDNALDKVLQLRGAEYDRIDRDNQHEIGVIAQEVEKIIPEVVHGDETKTVSYGNLVGLLIEAVKDLKKEIDELKSS